MGFGKKLLHLEPWNLKKLKKIDLCTVYKTLNISELASKPVDEIHKKLQISSAYNAIIENWKSYGINELYLPTFFDEDDKTSLITHDIIVPKRIKREFSNVPNLGTVYCGKYPSVTTILNHTRDALTMEQINDAKIDPDIYHVSEHLDSPFHQFLPHWMVHFRSLYEFKKEIPFALKQATKRNFEVTDKFMSNLRSIMRTINTIYLIKAYESVAVHPFLGYAGTVDYVGHEHLVNQLIEWKTLNKKRTGLDDLADIPLQAVAYLGALNYDSNHPFLQIAFATIGVLYNDGRPCDLYRIDHRECALLWAEWLRRLIIFKKKFSFLYHPITSFDADIRAKKVFNVEFKKKLK